LPNDVVFHIRQNF
jgi:hypothetical protein